MYARSVLVVLAAVLAAGCGGKAVSPGVSEPPPVFTLAASEYPSWSAFMVAGKAGLFNPEKGGKMGSLEEKWGVDVVLLVKDYDPCLTMFSSGTCDAACITNTDALNPAMVRPCTAILPTSTSVGADKVIGVGFDVRNYFDSPGAPGSHRTAAVHDFLKGKKTYGLSKSVSEYVWYRGLQKLNLKPSDYTFANMEPGPAATAVQTGSDTVQTICVWNPFALQTIRSVKETGVLFDSSAIPEEVIDMVVMGNDALAREGGEKFAACVCEAFYEVCRRLDDPKTADVTLQALGQDFSNLPVADMRVCTKETRFYSSAEAGVKLFRDEKFRQQTMPVVIKTCQAIGILEDGKQPTYGFDDQAANLNFSTRYMSR